MDDNQQPSNPDNNPYSGVKQHEYKKQPGLSVARILVICLMIAFGGIGLLLTMCGALISSISGTEGTAADAAAGLYFIVPGLGMALLAAGVVYIVVRSRPRAAPPKQDAQQPDEPPPTP